MVLSDNLNIMRGWNNYSYKIIRQRTCKGTARIGNTVYKSIMFFICLNIYKTYTAKGKVSAIKICGGQLSLQKTIIVKEQQVHGSLEFSPTPLIDKCIFCLRYTFTGIVINYHFRFLYYKLNKTNIRIYSSKVRGSIIRYYASKAEGLGKENEKIKLDPWWIAGFADGEACFHVYIIKNNEYKVGFQGRQIFEIHLHLKDEHILNLIKERLGVGSSLIKTRSTVLLKVNSIKDNEIIIAFFDKYPLITQKWADFQLWK